jgi:tetratricopeptide (TPR) repeat protein
MRLSISFKQGGLWVTLLWFALASTALAHGELHEQIEEISAKIQTSPKDGALYLKRAELQRLHQEPAAAALDYDEAERLAPALVEVNLGRGKLFFQTGQLEQARAALDRFLTAVPNHIDALVTRARVEAKRNRPLIAAEDFARVIGLSVKPEPEYYLEYARVLAEAGPDHIPQALEVLDKGTVKLGELATLGLLTIELELARKDFDSALDRLERLASKAKRKETWLERRGDILQQAGRPKDAHAAYGEALAAIQALPVQIRTKKATAELEARLSAKAASVTTK